MNDIIRDVEQARANAILIHDEAAVQEALQKMADGVNARFSGTNPLVICVMNGGMIPAGWLLPKLSFSFEFDYLHATRYRGKTIGSELQWISKPHMSLKDRDVLLIDDILDEGTTLASIIDFCLQQGAASVCSAVLVRKLHDRGVTDLEVDFCGLEVEDRYVFGCGMDYRNYLRNLPAIYGLAEEDE